MKAENFFFIITTVGIFGLFATMLYFETNETVESVDSVYFDQRLDYVDERFERLETGIQNSTRDICFQWGGQWLTDGNNLATRDFEIPVENGLFAKGQAIMCIKQKQEVQQ